MTANELISSALRLIGVKSQGQQATGAEAVDGLSVLNSIFDQWNAEGLMLYNTTTAFCNTVGGTSAYTIGPAGDIVTAVRPYTITAAWYRTTAQTVDTPIQLVTAADYGSIIQKSASSDVSWIGYYNPTLPTGTLTLYPVPNTANQLFIQYSTPLSSSTTLATVLTLPPAYERAIRYALAVALAPEYGFDPLPSIVIPAIQAKSIVERNNTRVPMLEYSLDIGGDYGVDYQWR